MIALEKMYFIIDKENLQEKLKNDKSDKYIQLCKNYLQEFNEEQAKLKPEEKSSDDEKYFEENLREFIKAVIKIHDKGHNCEFCQIYAEEFIRNLYEDGDRRHNKALYKAYKESRINSSYMVNKEGNSHLYNEWYIKNGMYKEAVDDILSEGKSKLFAYRYALEMMFEPLDDKARHYAEYYEKAYISAIKEGKSEIYAYIYADKMGNDHNYIEYCKCYAETYEKASNLFENQLYRQMFVDKIFEKYLIDGYLPTNNDEAKDDYCFYFDRFSEVLKKGLELESKNKIDGFALKYFNKFFNSIKSIYELEVDEIFKQHLIIVDEITTKSFFIIAKE